MSKMHTGIAITCAGVVGLCNMKSPILLQLVSMVITYYAIGTLLSR
jgi:hypothetical protein